MTTEKKTKFKKKFRRNDYIVATDFNPLKYGATDFNPLIAKNKKTTKFQKKFRRNDYIVATDFNPLKYGITNCSNGF